MKDWRPIHAKFVRFSQVPPALSGGLNTPTHLKRFRSSIPLYIFLLPAVVYLLLLSYQPMYGVQIAFRDYSLGAESPEAPGWGSSTLSPFLNPQISAFGAEHP